MTAPSPQATRAAMVSTAALNLKNLARMKFLPKKSMQPVVHLLEVWAISQPHEPP